MPATTRHNIAKAKGVRAYLRVATIKLYATLKHHDIDLLLKELLNKIVRVSELLYSYDSKCSPKTILRLYKRREKRILIQRLNSMQQKGYTSVTRLPHGTQLLRVDFGDLARSITMIQKHRQDNSGTVQMKNKNKDKGELDNIEQF